MLSKYIVSIIKLIIFILIIQIIKLQSQLIFNYENNKPKISVIVPVYNDEKFLSDCISSLLNQTFKCIEIICINDGSTDNSIIILKEFEKKDPRIRVINKRNEGAGAARNVALKIAQGNYIAFVDADDFAEPNYLEEMYNKIIYDNADVCICRALREDVKHNKIFEEKKLLDFTIIPNKVFSYRDMPENFFQITNTVPWNKLFKKNLITNNGLSFQEIERCNDYFFIYSSLIVADRITTVNKILYTQRINHGINLHSALYKSPYCFLEASSKLYEWLNNKGIYKILKNTFIKSFIKLSNYNLVRCKEHKEIFFKVFNRIKEVFQLYQVEQNIDILDSDSNKISKKFLFSTPEKEYERLQKKQNQSIPIAMFVDNNNILQTIVSMSSILENANKTNIYKYYLLNHKDFIEENKNKILDLCKKHHNKCELNFIKIGYDFIENNIINYIRHPMYYLFNLSNLIKENNKYIFINGDTIINEDLSGLFNININGFYIAGIKDFGIKYRFKNPKSLHIPNLNQYINLGVILLNLDEIRNEKIVDKFFNCISEKIGTNNILNYSDQDIINEICYGHIKIIPLKYNTMIDYINDENDILQKEENVKKYYNKAEWNEAFKNPVIIHYNGKIKPWNSIKCKFADFWFKYAPKTKEYKIIKKQIWYENFSSLPVEKYPEALKNWYKDKMGSNLDLEHPKSYTEKIQWLKLYDMDDLKTNLSDKYLVREYIKNKIGEKYLTKLLGVWDNFDDIDFDKLPDKFALKANHGCGFNIIVNNKTIFNKEDAKSKFENWLNTNFAYSDGLELQYKNIKRKIIAEEFLENNNGDLYDYKIWCFDGKPYYTMFLSERKKSLKMAFYDNDWKLQPFYYSYKKDNVSIKKPDNLKELLNISKTLSLGFKHVRVDFYRLNDGTLKFGEMTFTSASGIMNWHPEEYNQFFGNLIKLPID